MTHFGAALSSDRETSPSTPAAAAVTHFGAALSSDRERAPA
ncbi:MAG TPA: hypothetical protein VMF65_04675 [Acidimicrobiales bacterium]|nr:hypothetical protein [Acidimicrobiales bacterium]